MPAAMLPPGPPDLTPMCDAVLDALVKFPDSKDVGRSRDAFKAEVLTLRKFSGLVDKIHRARPPQSLKEEEHWTAVNALLHRGRRTLANLQERLTKTDSKDYRLHYSEPWKLSQEDRKPVAIATLRAHINLFTQTLQLSLTAFNL